MGPNERSMRLVQEVKAGRQADWVVEVYGETRRFNRTCLSPYQLGEGGQRVVEHCKMRRCKAVGARRVHVRLGAQERLHALTRGRGRSRGLGRT